jgi:hypothetical protein
MGEIYMNTFICLCDQWRTMGEIFMNTFVCLCDQWERYSWTHLFVYVINVNNGRDIHEHICLSMWSKCIHVYLSHCLHWSHRQTNVFMNISPIVYIDHIDKQMCSWISLPLFFIDHIDKQMCSWISLQLFTLIT